MEDLVVLHLSDLHIDGSSKKYSNILRGLLADIEKEIVSIPDERMVVVVTGDVINQGDRGAVNVAIQFFEDLYRIVHDKVVAIYVVPGNHDKFRTEENRFLIPLYRTIGNNRSLGLQFDSKFADMFWKYQEATYGENGSGYLGLTEKIYNIFGIEGIENKSFFHDTFGVDTIIVNEKKYCFVLLNTAWSCLDNSDNRSLVLGRFQLDRIKDQYKDIAEGSELTIVIGHHPIGFLNGEEEDELFSEMVSYEGICANVYLCGHTHSRSVNNWVNNRHSINTFMTGIGWPEDSAGHSVGFHTYSSYVFNLDINSIDVFVRSTDDGGMFVPDFRIYTNETQRNNKKMSFPIKAQNAQAYIPLESGSTKPPKSCYISAELMNQMKTYLQGIIRFQQGIESSIESDKQEFYSSWVSQNEDRAKNGEEPIVSEEILDMLHDYLFRDSIKYGEEGKEKIVEDFFSEHKNRICELILGFLQRICKELKEPLLGESVNADEDVRVHFRYISDKESLTYSKLCTSFTEGTRTEFGLSDMRYGELLEASFVKKKGLIYENNKELCTKGLSDRWTNFYTSVPQFDDNEFEKTIIGSKKKKQYPIVTFGVTISSDKFNWLLYCMDYFDFNHFLEEIINSYIRTFRVDHIYLCSWFKSELETEDNKEI